MEIYLSTIILISIIVLIHLYVNDKLTDRANMLISIIISVIIVAYSLSLIRYKYNMGDNLRDINLYYRSTYLPVVRIPFTHFLRTAFINVEVGFRLLNWIIGLFGSVDVLYYIEIQFLIMMVLVIFLGYLYTGWNSIDFFLLTFIIFPNSANLLVNVLRQGYAILIILIAYGLYVRNRDKIMRTIILLMIAPLFHSSSMYILLIFLLYIIFKKTKMSIYYTITIVLLITSLINVNKNLFNQYGNIFNDHFVSYSNGFGYSSTSKYLFIIISVFYACILLYFQKLKDKSPYIVAFWIKQYLSAIWLFLAFSYIAYSDRLIIYAWMIFFVAYHWEMTNTKKRQFILGFMFVIFIFIMSFLMTSKSYFINDFDF